MDPLHSKELSGVFSKTTVQKHQFFGVQLSFLLLLFVCLFVCFNFILLFIYFLIKFYLTLQYCIGFAIYQNESATGIHVFPILNPPPSSLPIPSLWVSQCTSPKHPVSCIEPGLVIRFIYDIIHVSMAFSQIIPHMLTLKLFYSNIADIQWCLSFGCKAN